MNNEMSTTEFVLLLATAFSIIFVPMGVSLLRHRFPRWFRRMVCRVGCHGYEIEPKTPFCHCPECGVRYRRTPLPGLTMQNMMDLDDEPLVELPVIPAPAPAPASPAQDGCP